MLADRLPLLRRRLDRALPRRFGDADPLADEIRHFIGGAVEQRANAAAHGVTQDHDLAHLQRAHREFDRGTDAVRLVVGAIGRRDIRDVADDETARPAGR